MADEMVTMMKNALDDILRRKFGKAQSVQSVYILSPSR